MTATLNELRREILTTAYNAGEGHIPSALSVLPVIWDLYNTMGPNDVFILSKGHGCLALYVVLAEKGILPRSELAKFCKPGAMLEGHPHIGIPGVKCSTGSLGHGIVQAVGVAYGKRLRGDTGIVHCLIGDGEAQEGSCFEALRLADEFQLKNLVVHIDMNENGRLRPRWIGYHNQYLRPHYTPKGYGIPAMELDPKGWHHKPLDKQTYFDMMEVLA